MEPPERPREKVAIVQVNRLGLRLTLCLAAALCAILGAFSYRVITLWERAHMEAAILETERFADTIKRSMESSMRRKEIRTLSEIIAAVGHQKGVEWVRMMNQEGKIIFSTNTQEIGAVVDKKAESCDLCHLDGKLVKSLEHTERSRILGRAGAHRVLATVDPIYNSRSCARADCHGAPSEQSVLGVLDVAVSLEATDALIRASTATIVGYGLVAVVLICLFVGLFLWWSVSRPVSALVAATTRVAAGDFASAIPIEGSDEIALLGRSFNSMTSSLRAADEKLHQLNESLERRIAHATRELTDSQAQIMRAEKLASVGRMAAGVAHELNNPLTGVLTFAHLVARKMPEGSTERADLEVVISETKRCAKIIRDLLQFARQSQPDRRPEDLGALIRQALLLLQHQADFFNIDVAVDIDPQLPRVVVDAGQITQVLINLVQNAVHAMPDGGTLQITASLRPAAHGAIDTVAVVIRDTGCGIAPENISKVFDPFFTTKEPGKGTGLGLSVSLRMIESHGGTMDIASTLGAGTQVTVALPVGDCGDMRRQA